MGKHGSKFLTVIFALALFGCPQGKRDRSATIFVGLADVSGSTDANARCAELFAPLAPFTTDARLQRLDVLLLATGDAATGEPRVLVPWTTWSPSGELFEAPDAAEKQRRSWIARTYSACLANMRPSDVSPVYEGVRAGKSAIDARCHDIERTGFACTRKRLTIASDLRSTYGPFGSYLRALARPSKRHPPQAPPRLALDGIDATWCGTANTTVDDGLSLEVVLKAWTTVLGNAPLVDPTCERLVPPEREASL